MEIWKRNLWICCIASFIVSIGMSQMAPMLPLYVAELGVTNPGDVARWSGIIFSCNFISLAIFSPIWGRLSDRYGRKPMVLRASLALAVIMFGMGLAQNVWQLCGLRLIQGTMSGFQAAIIPMVAQEAPSDRSGWALGMFFTSQVSGALLGPVFGGWLAETVGYRYTFFVIGSFCLMGFFSIFALRENFHVQPQAAALGLRESFQRLPNPKLIVGLLLRLWSCSLHSCPFSQSSPCISHSLSLHRTILHSLPVWYSPARALPVCLLHPASDIWRIILVQRRYCWHLCCWLASVLFRRALYAIRQSWDFCAFCLV